jgi:hypothetical protein
VTWRTEATVRGSGSIRKEECQSKSDRTPRIGPLVRVDYRWVQL